MFARQNARGFSLIEMMVALTIGLLLLNFIVEIYLGTAQSTQLQNDLLQLQMNAKRAIALLQNEIKTAGYIGCARLTKDFPLKLPSINYQNKLMGEDHSISVRYADLPLGQIVKINKNQLTIITQKHLHEGSELLIADCAHAEVVSIQQIHHSHHRVVIDLTKPIKNHYEKNVMVGLLQIKKFFIAKSKLASNGKHSGSLVVSTKRYRQKELINQIDAMNFIYFVSNHQQLIGRQAGAIADWSQVVAVQIALHVTQFPYAKWWYVLVPLRS